MLSHTHGHLASAFVLSCSLLLCFCESFATEVKQSDTGIRSLTPLQLAIEKQRQRLSSAEAEDRRDAVMQLGAMRHPEASRIAVSALKDPLPIVRASAARAISWLPPLEGSKVLIPLLGDKVEFVRQEAAYALGQTRSKSAVGPLIERLAGDKKDGVRGAAAVALGEIADEAAAVSLMQVLSRQTLSPGAKQARKNKHKENVLVLRAAAHSLGQIASRQAIPALVEALENEQMDEDVRREAAVALGRIGDPLALPALGKALNAQDPYLSLAAQGALRNISH